MRLIQESIFAFGLLSGRYSLCAMILEPIREYPKSGRA